MYLCRHIHKRARDRSYTPELILEAKDFEQLRLIEEAVEVILENARAAISLLSRAELLPTLWLPCLFNEMKPPISEFLWVKRARGASIVFTHVRAWTQISGLRKALSFQKQLRLG